MYKRRSSYSSYSSNSAICIKDKSHGELRMCHDFTLGMKTLLVKGGGRDSVQNDTFCSPKKDGCPDLGVIQIRGCCQEVVVVILVIIFATNSISLYRYVSATSILRFWRLLDLRAGYAYEWALKFEENEG